MWMPTTSAWLPSTASSCASDFYTLDVADAIGRPAPDEAVGAFVGRHPELVGRMSVPGIDEPFVTTPESIEAIARKYLFAVLQAGGIYRHIAENKSRRFHHRSLHGRDRRARKRRPNCW